jgi:hypothetical protein
LTPERAINSTPPQKGTGLGYGLMLRSLDDARQRRVGQMFGEVLAENGTMLQMAEEPGFLINRRPTPRLRSRPEPIWRPA